MKNKLDRSSKALMLCDLINTIINLFGETFLVAYFLQISNENVTQIAIYQIIVFMLLGLGSLILGNVIKSNFKNKIVIYRTGMIVKSVNVLLIVLFKEQINQYFVAFAILYGISAALYWSAHDIMNIEIVSNEQRKDYMTIKRIFGKILNIIFPIILGTTIELTSFTYIATYIFTLTLIQIILSLNIDINKFNICKSKEKYSLKNYVKNLSIKQKIKLYKIYKLAFLYGIIMDTINILVIIITIMTFKSSLNLGILTTIFSICAMFSLYIFNKFYQKQHTKAILTVYSILVVFGVFCLIFNINRTTLIMYNFTYAITACILEVMFKIKSEDVVKEYSIEEWIVEYHTFIEGFMDIGRIVGFSLMLLIGMLNNIVYFKILLIMVTICIPIYAINMYKVEKNYTNEGKNEKEQK